MCGEGAHGELGLGVEEDGGGLAVYVDRPRLNNLLTDDGVVDIACGG
jgi:alpha-tubulin suppressor-like RCC1 family protein